jgi:hypothetical protein
MADSPIPKYEEVSGWIDGVLKGLFGDQIPPIVSKSVAIALAVAVVLLGLWGILFVLSKIKDIWVRDFFPLFYNAEQRRQAELRRRFAEHIRARLNILNSRESWQDYRFTELEAEVEAEGQRKKTFGLQMLTNTPTGLRRERSLTAALRHSDERLILIEGEPGSGKSVALRHVANLLVERAAKSRSQDSLIPIYLNLRELRRTKNQSIDRNLVESFVLRSLNANDRDVEEFLDGEFNKGMRNGTWIFLFDSFDELPDVLSSTEADATIRMYAEAIHEFLHGMNKCRGMIASRYFRGPTRLTWPRFRILALARERRVKLIHKIGLSVEVEQKLIAWTDSAGQDFYLLVKNPMFLGLVCNHVRKGYSLPESPHMIFEAYIQSRLAVDSNRLHERYGFEPAQVRLVAEQVAFSMAADPGLGLSPSRDRLPSVMKKFAFGDEHLDSALDALEYMKLVKSESGIQPGDAPFISFSHRRFQEYFATCILLREPGHITPEQLLTDGRWREPVVVMCQTQPLEILLPLVRQVNMLLEQMVSVAVSQEQKVSAEKQASKQQKTFHSFEWPQGALHVCGILQDGFGSRLNDLPDELRANAAALLAIASKSDNQADHKWALEVAGAVKPEIFLELIRKAFNSESSWLRNTAFLQTARLADIPHDIAWRIRDTLINMAKSGRLADEGLATRAHVSRLNKAQEFQASLRLLEWAEPINGCIHLLGLFFLLTSGNIQSHSFAVFALLSVLLFNALVFWKNESEVFMRLFFVYLTWKGAFDNHTYVSNSTHFWYEVFCRLTVTYMILWGAGAIKAARLGIFRNPITWIALPIVVPWEEVKNLTLRFRKIRTEWKGLIINLGYPAAMIFVFTSYDTLSQHYKWVHVIGICFMSLISILGGVLAIMVLFAVTLALNYWLRGRYFYWRTMRTVRNIRLPLNKQELFGIMEKCTTDNARAHVLTKLRVGNLICSDIEVLEAIRVFIIQAQQPLQGPRAFIYKQSKIDLCDELCRTLDQLKTQVGEDAL